MNGAEEVVVTKDDIKKLEEFIEPIKVYWRDEELKREAELQKIREKRAKDARVAEA